MQTSQTKQVQFSVLLRMRKRTGHEAGVGQNQVISETMRREG